MKKITRRDLIILAVILSTFTFFVVPRLIFSSKKGGFSLTQKGGQIYYCPMHPTYTSDRPGDCPICNMKLVPKQKVEGKAPMGAEGDVSKIPGHAMVHIPTDRQQIIGVKLGVVEKRKVAKEIRTSGKVAFDPDLFTAQQEFISALQGVQKAHSGPYHEPKERAQALVEATRVRLRLLGMSDLEIAELEKGGTQDRNLILPPAIQASLSSKQGFVWVYAAIYEYELSFVKVGMSVKARVPTFPDQEFSGAINALDPVLDPTTRSIRIRARVENP
ncbi:MAG: efflux RND transporter periplasmic adaptor subunit, partial [Candidatus Omnitrophica bacterium]|nr:efflux RND transporter periplasmic adaptor subunit [Candidatus Omnitrophota bacterium]